MKEKLALALIIAVLITPGAAFAWENKFHIQMVKDSVALCPTELRKFLNDNINAVLLGSIDPNTTISTPIGYAYGYRKHYYIPEGNKGDAPDEVAALSLSVIELFSKNFPDNQLIARRMGMVSHFIADALQPKRYIGLAPNYPADFIEEQFRSKDITYLPVIYNGYNPIIDFSGDLKSFSRDLWYRDTTDDQYYDMGVNFIVDVWITIWEKSGKVSGDMIATGSRIRPEIPPKETAPSTVFSPSEILDLKSIGDTTGTGMYDEKTFDIDAYGKSKEPGEEPGSEETPLEKKSPEEIESATGTPPPPGTTTTPGETTESAP